MSFFSELDIDAQEAPCDCIRCHGTIAQSEGRRAPMCVFSDENIGKRAARHIIWDRRQDADLGFDNDRLSREAGRIS